MAPRPYGSRISRLARFLRDVVERASRRYYEGPDAPERFARYAEEFSRLYPRATVGEWIAMSSKLAGQAYRSGWTRGYEWAERELDRPEALPEARAAHDAAHEWAWAGGGELPPKALEAVPPKGRVEQDELAIYLGERRPPV